MARVIKEHEYAAKRGDILDVAQRLIATKGYEQMTIRHILDDLQISKGAFYHYFSSKTATLEAIIERMLQEVEQLLLPIVYDPQLPALEKFQRFFAVSARWKTARKTFLLALMRVWYTDDNAIVRQKLRSTGLKRIAPLLMVIIRQGIHEGVLTTAFPDEAGEVVVSLVEDLGDTLGEIILAQSPDRDSRRRIERTVAVYGDAVERVLGAPTASLQLVDAQIIEEWLVASSDVELFPARRALPF